MANLRPDLAPLFDPFFARALTKNPAKRINDATSLVAMIDELIQQVPDGTPAGKVSGDLPALVPGRSTAATLLSMSGNLRSLSRSRKPLLIGVGAGVAALTLIGAIALSGGDDKPAAPDAPAVTKPAPTTTKAGGRATPTRKSAWRIPQVAPGN